MYARGKFGIEFTPPEPKPESSGVSRLVWILALVAVVLVSRAVWNRIRTGTVESSVVEIVEDAPEPAARADVASTNLPPPVVRQVDYGSRPIKVRNLLLRLAEAEKRRDVEMAVSTIELLRATPGAADLDDSLARRLGSLNLRRLFKLKSGQWTVSVVAKRGDSASRIAYEHGSTFASLKKLNGSELERLKVGQRLTVMNHPRFNLVVTRRTRTADLTLNGKFFKRYDLQGDVTGAPGSYETPERFRNFCSAMGVSLRPEDRAELEMLLPVKTAVFIREM